MTSSDRTISREKAVAFIVARLSSSRLPAKQLRSIGDKKIIEWTLDGLSKSEELDEIVIATVAEEENEPLRDFARERGIPCFWYEGEVDHVTTRLRRAAEEFEADLCVLVSGDCPLMHAPLIDAALRELRTPPKVDVVKIKHEVDGEKLSQQGLAFVRRETWQRADDMSDRPELKEHFFPIIGQRPRLFSSRFVTAERPLYSPLQRASVDTYSDLQFMRQIHDQLLSKGLNFCLSNAISLVRDNSKLLNINSHVHQRNLIEDIKRVLYFPFLDSNSYFNSIESACKIVDRTSWPVTLVADKIETIDIALERGFRHISLPIDCETEEFNGTISTFDIFIFDIDTDTNYKYSSIIENLCQSDFPVALRHEEDNKKTNKLSYEYRNSFPKGLMNILDDSEP